MRAIIAQVREQILSSQEVALIARTLWVKSVLCQPSTGLASSQDSFEYFHQSGHSSDSVHVSLSYPYSHYLAELAKPILSTSHYGHWNHPHHVLPIPPV